MSKRSKASMLDRARLWWQIRTGEEDTPFDDDMYGWVISMSVHLAALVILGIFITLVKPEPHMLIELSTIDEEELEEEEKIIEEFAFSEEKVDEIGANSFSGVAMAMAEAPIEAELSEIPVEVFEAEVGVQVELTEATLATGPNVSNNSVRGAAGVGTTGAMGAIDRLTHEILLSVEQRKTLVVWLFDKSGSLQRQRNEINERFERVYKELGVIEESGNQAFGQYKDEEKPLLTQVVAFGKDFDVLTQQPTDNLEEIKGAVASIKNDPSGLENVFSAVTKAANMNLKYRTQEDRRNVMLVVFSDEIGDDQNNGLDPTVRLCRKYQMPVYVVGVPAPFGRQEVEIKYVDPDPEYDQSVQWVPVKQGPESFMPERIRLAFSGSQKDEPIDSGFGPYSLTRLCYETGGIYFAVHPNRNQGQSDVSKRDTSELSAHIAHFFHPAKMRAYRPDYVPAADYVKLLKTNRARASLVQAAQMSWSTPMSSPKLNFPKQGEAELANLLSDAQREAASLEPQIQAVYDKLVAGEADRAKLNELRWQAGYDLAIGRAAAVLVRTKGYNAMLAKAKQGMKFEDDKSDTWILEPSDEISVGSALEKLGKKANMYLTRVVEEHEGTPWAMLAAKELETPLGWKWNEEFNDVNRPREMAGNGNANPRNDKRKMLTKPKPKRKVKL